MKGLAFKLSSYLLAGMVIILFGLLFYNYKFSRTQALQDAKSDAKKLTELTVSQIRYILGVVENIPTNMATIIESRDTTMFKGTVKVIEQMLKENTLIYGTCIAFAPRISNGDTILYAPYVYVADDSLVYKDLGDEQYHYVKKEWYVQPRDLGKGVWSEPYYDEGGGEALMATYSVPFYRNSKGKKTFAGVVTADISLRGLQKIIKDIQFFDSGYGFLISSAGNVVTYPGIDSLDDKKVHNFFSEDYSPGMKAVVRKMVNGETGLMPLREINDNKHDNRWVSYGNIKGADWSLAIVFNERELYRGVHELLSELTLLGLIGAFLIALMIFLVSGRFIKPLQKLAFATRQIGSGDLDYQVPEFRSNDEIAQLGQAFNIMQKELKVYIADLKETTAQKEKIESELMIASNIQQQMLPNTDEMPGMLGMDIFGMLKPARQVGGDLFDIQLKEEFLYFAIGDVSGKGIPAALFMAKTLTLFRAKVNAGNGPAQLAEEINHELEMYNAESMFVTFFIGKINMTSGKLVYSNAGHNLPFLLRAAKTPELIPGTHGLPLGSIPGLKYEEGQLTLRKGEKVFLYTDGISEAMNTREDLFGEERMLEVLDQHKTDSTQIISEAMLHTVESFASGTEQSDDITMLVIGYQ